MLSVCFQRLESARKEKEEYERQAERERLEAMAKDRQKMEEKVAEEKKLKDMLKEQMLELKAREIEVSRRPLVNSVQLKMNLFIFGPKHMLLVLKRTVSVRRFF